MSANPAMKYFTCELFSFFIFSFCQKKLFFGLRQFFREPTCKDLYSAVGSLVIRSSHDVPTFLEVVLEVEPSFTDFYFSACNPRSSFCLF